jgi:predicted metal-dependent phosphotriesterase family hydrolase
VQEHDVKTVVEPTAMFIGRDVAFSRKVSEETGLQLVPCTGIYTYDHLPPFFAARDADALKQAYVKLGSRLGRTPGRTEITWWFLAGAAALLVAALALSARWAARLP